MKKTLFALTATAAIGLAAPAFAQASNRNYDNRYDIRNYDTRYDDRSYQSAYEARIDRIQDRVEDDVESGSISRNRATALRQQLRDLNRLERQYSRNGFTTQERRDLDARISTLRQDVRLADGGRAWRDRDDEYARLDWIDRNNDGWDDRDYNRDGWPDDAGSGRYTGRGGPYEPVEACETRTGIGGIVDRVFGQANCGLRAGQRASGDLYAVPYQYRNQYRDSGNTIYRSDGRSIYQIDARTNVVTRVYAID